MNMCVYIYMYHREREIYIYTHIYVYMLEPQVIFRMQVGGRARPGSLDLNVTGDGA